MVERVAVFVDGQNLYQALKAHHIGRVDYDRLAAEFSAGYGNLVYKYMCMGVFRREDGFCPPIRFMDALKYKGWEVDKARVEMGREKEADAALTWKMAEGLHRDRWDVLLLFSGDGDLAYPVWKLRQGGKRVIVVQFQNFISLYLAGAASEVVLLDEVSLDRFKIDGDPTAKVA